MTICFASGLLVNTTGITVIVMYVKMIACLRASTPFSLYKNRYHLNLIKIWCGNGNMKPKQFEICIEVTCSINKWATDLIKVMKEDTVTCPNFIILPRNKNTLIINTNFLAPRVSIYERFHCTPQCHTFYMYRNFSTGVTNSSSLFSCLSTVVVLPLIPEHNWLLTTTSFIHQTAIILDQTRQNEYQTVALRVYVYIHNLMLVSFWSDCSETSLGVVVILPLMVYVVVTEYNVRWYKLQKLVCVQMNMWGNCLCACCCDLDTLHTLWTHILY